ncbi:hypothetical protein RvY_10641 [Ramazzottius varieornatus]|uniref:HTH psq-type domain-containing protein n=1 Tax=Ramazzottius varieornatus TaxID=947166 RepID=A0A1D1VFI0_RAMVA|nr:hypothetical protein RvY_10641 [Ramazzottius varieornatus]
MDTVYPMNILNLLETEYGQHFQPSDSHNQAAGCSVLPTEEDLRFRLPTNTSTVDEFEKSFAITNLLNGYTDATPDDRLTNYEPLSNETEPSSRRRKSCSSLEYRIPKFHLTKQPTLTTRNGSIRQLNEWERQLAAGGSRIDKLEAIGLKTGKQFFLAKQKPHVVKDMDIQRWALTTHRDVGLAGFQLRLGGAKAPKLKTSTEAHAQLTLEAASQAVAKLEWSERESAMLYGVNRRTLSNRLNNRHLGPHRKQPKIPPQEEALADFVLACSGTGIPLIRQHCAAPIVEINNRHAFNDQHSCRFLQRHPTLSIRVTHANNRKKDRDWTHELADKYISKLTELLFHRAFLDEPEQVWNLDESVFNTAEMFDRVVGRKGMRQIYSQFDGTEKELVTILPCGNAAGLQLPFMALFSGKRHVRSRLDGTSGHCYPGVNDSGTMDQLHFANYLNDRVIPGEVAAKDYQPIFERLTESLSAELDIVDQNDRDEILEFIGLKQRGVTPGAVLAASL